MTFNAKELGVDLDHEMAWEGMLMVAVAGTAVVV